MYEIKIVCTWLFCPFTWLASIEPPWHWYFGTQTRPFPWHGTVCGGCGCGGKYPGALYNLALLASLLASPVKQFKNASWNWRQFSICSTIFVHFWLCVQCKQRLEKNLLRRYGLEAKSNCCCGGPAATARLNGDPLLIHQYGEFSGTAGASAAYKLLFKTTASKSFSPQLTPTNKSPTRAKLICMLLRREFRLFYGVIGSCCFFRHRIIWSQLTQSRLSYDKLDITNRLYIFSELNIYRGYYLLIDIECNHR